ncbi:MAG TPA: O-antigen ligase family protein [Bacillota bacterium]|nr:O-antigen ligase family protein [Bacillota bacterium]
MESALISLWKNTASKTAAGLNRVFEKSLTGGLVRYLGRACRESFTGRLISGEPVRKSLTYSLLRDLCGALERAVSRMVPGKSRLLRAVTHGSFLALLLLAVSALVFLPRTGAPAALGAVLAAAAVLYRPECGLYLAALLLPFAAFKVLFLLSLLTLASFVLSVLNGSRRARFHLSPLAVPLLLFCLVMLYATVTSIWPFPSLSEFLIPVTGLVYLLVMVNVFDTGDKLDTFVFLLAVAGFIAACYAIFHFYSDASILEVKKEWVDVKINPGVQNRAYAGFDNPNLLAQYLTLLAAVLTGALSGPAGRLRRLFYALTAAAAVFCLVLTYSRGGYVALAAAMIVFAVFINRLLLPVLTAAGIFAYSFLPHSILARLATITSMKDSSSLYRLDTWKSTMSLIESHWETGVGLGRNAFARVYYTHMINSNVVPHSHNLYLQIISEFGILGLAVFVWLFLAVFKLGLKLCSDGSARIRSLNAGIMGAIAGFLVHSTVDYFLWYYKIAILLWLLIAVLLTLEKLAEGRPAAERNE